MLFLEKEFLVVFALSCGRGALFCPSPRMCYNIHLFQEEENEEDEGDYYDDADEEHSYDDEDDEEDEEEEEDDEDDEVDEGEQSFHAKNFVSYMQKIILIAWIESI